MNTPKEKVSECRCKCHRIFKEPTGCVPCVENHPRPAPSHLKEEPPTEVIAKAERAVVFWKTLYDLTNGMKVENRRAMRKLIINYINEQL